MTTNSQLNCSKWEPFHRQILGISIIYSYQEQETIYRSNLSTLSDTTTPSSKGSSQDLLNSRMSYLNLWRKTVLEQIRIDLDSLPNQTTSKDLDELSNHLPSKLYIEILHDLILISLSIPNLQSNQESNQPKDQFKYTATSRALVFRVTHSLRIPLDLVYHAERIVAQELFSLFKETQKESHDQTLSDQSKEALSNSNSKSKWLRYIGAGAGLIVGGVTIGLTGGLAAPLLAPLLVTLSGGGLGFLATAGGSVLIGTLFGIAGGGLTGYRAQRRMKGIEEFEFVRISPSELEPNQTDETKDLTHVPSLHATIVCSGFLLTPTDYKDTWKPAYSETIDSRDIFAIKLETGALLEAGKSLDTYVRDVIVQQGTKEILKRTVLASFISAVALPAVIYKTATVALDNEFLRVRDKCEKGAILLADMIEANAHGTRPLTLVGSSMGAITIFHALLELSKRNVVDTIDQVILIGAPISPSPKEWASVKKIVSRRIVNVYSQNDWVLAILVRLHSLISVRMSIKVAGLGDLGIEGVEEVDVSDLVDGHLDLSKNMKQILDRVGINK
ncbi:uncharacterized protein MELLADRAFT_116771 [Melampsora larici-populina 98AG31]|uniref:DUF726-domain-containing protein n=1 Tax=Melampsora larici-populina (strain 98AG31 / pathotype 3-4-7) TaxID=747676 RepID=F4RPU7_MELLP|nr:uncharacterized protein MELLADRAFT_116771 [Melampsora larici-populina 98AG31]EGG05676.1 hypothetical protein MELLADRAFT_116771 [Melampsora larici-populina 98AG31]